MSEEESISFEGLSELALNSTTESSTTDEQKQSYTPLFKHEGRKFKTLLFSTSASDAFHTVTLNRLQQYTDLLIVKDASNFDQNDESLMRREILDTDLICFDPYSTIKDIYVPLINDRVERGELALVFFRGIDCNSAPYMLQYVNVPYVDWANSSSFSLDIDGIRKVDSQHLNRFLRKYHSLTLKFSANREKLIDFDENGVKILKELTANIYEHFFKLDLSGSYICGQSFNKMEKENDWLTFGYGKGEHDHVGRSILVHKTYKVMFPHFYGFSEQDSQFSKDLLRCLFEYLLLEHGKRKGSLFFSRLLKSSQQGQLSDILITSKGD
ncbi:hypothetical protein FDP41_011755 [Naegleria fowleri]|uniref:Uncharacterized protein n=1 Tax=Naegleria fowleri TaxID=5763 RepID=A0A6A5C5Z1_NAEFO|nr:uncharacterized protein FDP41_011755 [Naegleria fowleri]KAF0981894.1 hypothetical protein FDP41_011755 [Naegleria fowleri]CAG4713513.1 unnamed protein product [Naegleria fowleri]